MPGGQTKLASGVVPGYIVGVVPVVGVVGSVVTSKMMISSPLFNGQWFPTGIGF